jgi:hypothetical protein
VRPRVLRGPELVRAEGWGARAGEGRWELVRAERGPPMRPMHSELMRVLPADRCVPRDRAL